VATPLVGCDMLQELSETRERGRPRSAAPTISVTIKATDEVHARQALIGILQNAFSGELAAAYAYRGHWKSLSDRAEREKIQSIENDEWVHRANVKKMLSEMGAAPRRPREVRAWTVGRTLGIGCHLIGWFLPMYFAGRLESRNIVEYEDAADHARTLGFSEYLAELKVMADVERDHEAFFRGKVANHRLLPLARSLFKWG
jgi:demethoxyubiquinone hydroxylase (CLK1/Coq7/Cat5 family)